MKSMHLANYHDAVAYMSLKIAEIDSANKSITGNPRRILQGTTSPNTVSVQNCNEELITNWEGVDRTQPTQTFTSEEQMTQLGIRGRGILAKIPRIANGGREAPLEEWGGGCGFSRRGRGHGGLGRDVVDEEGMADIITHMDIVYIKTTTIME